MRAKRKGSKKFFQEKTGNTLKNIEKTKDQQELEEIWDALKQTLYQKEQVISDNSTINTNQKTQKWQRNELK